MGHGVAQVTAAAGYDVLGIESQQSALDAGVKRIDDSLSKVSDLYCPFLLASRRCSISNHSFYLKCTTIYFCMRIGHQKERFQGCVR